ncbi:hypothetical protein RclHR1_05670001 [Rhizophagus clarus]|uniref:Uncharacterized protein n=1 Tax=Rhizophagus clarus TaxID=94130 RepID=A0A2Z6SGE5_9GLOM|nr:hypothetical protein RclHR1_05670001 [Rhizophagus clarus]
MLVPELHFEADHFKSLRTPFEADHFKSRTPFRGRPLSLEVLYRQTTVWKKWTELFRRSRTLIRSGLWSGTPLGADYDISKRRTMIFRRSRHSIFEDWTLFEDLVTIFEDYFEGPDEAQTPFKDPGRRNTVHLSKVCGWIPRRNFEGLGLPGTLRNFEGALRSSFYYFFEIS